MTTDKFDSSSLLALFFDELATHLQAIEEQLSKDLDHEVIFRAIHSIKGGINLLSYQDLIPLFTALETLVHQEENLGNYRSVLERCTGLVREISRKGAAELFNETAKKKEEIDALTAEVNQLIQPQTNKSTTPKPLSQEPSDDNLYTLFTTELESLIPELTEHLIRIEKSPNSMGDFEALMRISHSIKGSANVLSLEPIVQLAHTMESCFLLASEKKLVPNTTLIDLLLTAVDYLHALSQTQFSEVPVWLQTYQSSIEILTKSLETPDSIKAKEIIPPVIQPKKTSSLTEDLQGQERTLRVTARHLDRLMGLAGESLVDSGWLEPFTKSLAQLKDLHNEIEIDLEKAKDTLSDEHVNQQLIQLMHKSNDLRLNLNERLGELETFVRKNASLSDRLYQEVINIRMRPFNDGVSGLPRMCRDLSNELGKQVRLTIQGKNTPVDREILEKLESPLNHLIRNAIDHGIETPEERERKGKPAEGTISVTANHKGGLLEITISDDGRGVNFTQLREKLPNQNLTKQELLSHLFLPNFTTKEEVTENSGRGFGLDVAKEVVHQIGGDIHLESETHQGMKVTMQLPLTLSLVRALIVETAHDPYAFPLSRIGKTNLVAREDIKQMEGRNFFFHQDKYIGLINASEILGFKNEPPKGESLNVVVINNGLKCYGVIVDKFLGEKELVVQELDPTLGKVPNILAGAFLEDGSPLLIFDVDDLLKSIDQYLLKETAKV